MTGLNDKLKVVYLGLKIPIPQPGKSLIPSSTILQIDAEITLFSVIREVARPVDEKGESAPRGLDI